MRRILLALALLLAASPLAAYVIVFKDGSRLEAREKYKVQGNMAMITLKNGSQTTAKMDQIDVARTDAANFGSATTVAEPNVPPTPPPTPPPPSLGQLAGQRHMTPPAPPVRATPKPAAAATPADGPKGAGRTPAGYVDFLREPRVPASNVPLAGRVGELLRAHGVAQAAIYNGTAPRRLLVEVAANSEGGVFQAIAASAQAALDLEAKQPGALEGLELFIATDNRQRCGQFFVTADRARELLTKQLDLAGFYLKYVEF